MIMPFVGNVYNSSSLIYLISKEGLVIIKQFLPTNDNFKFGYLSNMIEGDGGTTTARRMSEDY